MSNGNTTWTTSGYQVLVNGKPFFANGVSYSPLPWGACTAFQPYGDFTIETWSSVWQRDVGLMRQNKVNVFKTYNTLNEVQTPGGDINHGPCLDACWNGGANPVFMLMGYAPANNVSIYVASTWSQQANVNARKKIAGELVALAKTYAGYPAVMGFVMANEINANNVVYGSNNQPNAAFFQFWNDVANEIGKVAPGKLTLLANVDDSMNTPTAGNPYMTAANFVWGINSYRGNWTNSNGFDNLFSTFYTATQQPAVSTGKPNPKPLLLTEWGAPSSTHSDFPASPSTGTMTAMSKQQMADLSTYVAGHYNNMIANRSDTGAGVCGGGAYFEWTDEWWKADPIQCNAPNAAPACYAGVWNPGPNMSFQGNFPGGYWDEEGFGLHSIAPVSPSTRVPPAPGGCVGPWDPEINQPYPPDQLTALAHAKALFELFAKHPPGGAV